MAEELFLEKSTGRVFKKNPDGSYEFVREEKAAPKMGRGVFDLEPEKALGISPAARRVIEGGAKRAIFDIPGAMGDVVFEGGQALRRATGGFLPEVPMMRPSQALREIFQIPEPQGFGEKLATEAIAGAGSGAMLGPLSMAAKGLSPAQKVEQALMLSKMGGAAGGA